MIKLILLGIGKNDLFWHLKQLTSFNKKKSYLTDSYENVYRNWPLYYAYMLVSQDDLPNAITFDLFIIFNFF